jgi:hypothetical protein
MKTLKMKQCALLYVHLLEALPTGTFFAIFVLVKLKAHTLGNLGDRNLPIPYEKNVRLKVQNNTDSKICLTFYEIAKNYYKN